MTLYKSVYYYYYARHTKLWLQRQFTLLPWCCGKKPHFLFAEPWKGGLVLHIFCYYYYGHNYHLSASTGFCVQRLDSECDSSDSSADRTMLMWRHDHDISDTSRTDWHQSPTCPRDLPCVLRRLATSSCRGHVDESATGLSLSPHREHGTGCRHGWSCCGRQNYLDMNAKHKSFTSCTNTIENRLACFVNIYAIILWWALGLYSQGWQK